MKYSYEQLIHLMEDQIPFNRFLGVKVDSISRGHTLLKIPFFPQAIGDPFRPALHGGLISMLADTAGGLAIFTKVEDTQVVSTLDLRIDYLRPGQINHDLFASSEVVRMGNRFGVVHTVIYQQDPTQPVATSTGVYTIVESKASN